MAVMIRQIFLLLFLTLSYAAVFSPEFERKLNSYIEASMKCHHIPGMTLSVVKGDEVWLNGYGKEDLFADIDVDSDSKFIIGSVTKSFTAALLGMLLSEKGLNWTAKVTDILGSDYQFVDAYRTKELTLRDLLSHRTGLARYDYGLDPTIPKSVTRSEFCKRMKYLPEERPVRDGFIYNNYMYMMLGHVAEALGQDTWENLVRTRVFQPLGMNSTTIMESPADVFAPNVARPYIYLDDKFYNGTREIYDFHPVEPAGAIMSTALDMTKWMKFHLNLGKTESGTQLIDKRLMQDMHTVTTALSHRGDIPNLTKPKFPADDILIGYGYAWFLSEYRGFKNNWHSGGIGSYRTLLRTFPDMNIGLFASVNGPRVGSDDYMHRVATFYYLSDHLLGLEPWLNNSTACSFPEPWYQIPKKTSSTPESPLQLSNLGEFEGTYGSHLFPDIQVSSNSTDLIFTTGIVRGILHPSSEKDRFLYETIYPMEYANHENNTDSFTNITFNRDATTKAVNALTIQLEVDLKFEKKPDPQIVG